MVIPPIILKASSKVTLRIRRQMVKTKLKNYRKLHLACGDNILEGWANIDIHKKGNVIGWNLTHKLPIQSETINLVFCEHFIEHITFNQARTLLAECHRCLRNGGILRLSTPSLAKMIKEYLSGKTTEWSDVGWHPITPCQMINDGFRLWGHQFIYDDCELEHLLLDCGFREIRKVSWRQSINPELRNLECRPFHNEIILEAVK